MIGIRKGSLQTSAWWMAALLVVGLAGGCSQQDTASTAEAPAVKKMAPGQEFSGFLGDYSALKPIPDMEGTVAYVNKDLEKNLHRYIAIIIDPVEIYVATDDDPAQLPAHGREAITNYFMMAMTRAVADAFPVVDTPGPLVLRLRTALVGVDIGDKVTGEMPEGAEPLERPINIGEVGVELEFVDSVTGERVAAAVNRSSLAETAEVDVANFSRMEKYEAATRIIDGWANGIRNFLDEAHKHSDEDAARAVESYHPYGQ